MLDPITIILLCNIIVLITCTIHAIKPDTFVSEASTILSVLCAVIAMYSLTIAIDYIHNPPTEFNIYGHTYILNR